MELKEAYKVLNVSQEERASIERYLGFKHTSINILADLTPGNYKRLNNAGWKLPETEEEIKECITDFVNVYAAMYKESKKSDTPMNLIRGTNRRNIPSNGEKIHQILSTSTDESVAKRFCEYGNAALICFRVAEGVPFLDAEKYRDENAATEDEIILAPFCRVTKNERMGEFNGYDYYRISIEKIELEEQNDDNIKIAMKEVINSFTKNIANMKKVNSLSEEYEVLTEKTRRGIQNREDQIFVSKKMQELLKQYGDEGKKIDYFKERLQFLLKGLCKQKELEIDRAQEVIDVENERIAQEKILKAEEERKMMEKEESEKIFSELSTKALKMPNQSANLIDILESTYKKLLQIEQTYKGVAARFQIPHAKSVSEANIENKFRIILENINKLQDKVRETNFSEGDSLKNMQQVSSTLTPVFDSVAYSLEIAHDIPEIANIYQSQLENQVKKNLYIKVQQAIQEARVDKYLLDKTMIESEKSGFFDTITRKSDLKSEKLKNIDLKIKLAKSIVPQQKEKYSIRDMLADLYTCGVVELGGRFTLKMQQLYEDMKIVYGDSRKGEFSDEYIKQLANDKIINMQRNLPIISKKTTPFWRKTKSQIDLLRLENQSLEMQIQQEKTKNSSLKSELVEQDAIDLFDFKLNGIQSITTNKSQSMQNKDKYRTLDLLG